MPDMPPKKCLPFEKEIYAMEELLAQLEANANGQLGGGEEVRRLRRELANLKRKIYSDLQPWQTILVARHEERPQLLDYIDLLLDQRDLEPQGFRHVAPGALQMSAPATGHERWVINKLRALCAWYSKGLDSGSHLRIAINRAESVAQLRQIVEDFFITAPASV